MMTISLTTSTTPAVTRVMEVLRVKVVSHSVHFFYLSGKIMSAIPRPTSFSSLKQ
jgi:hypothetical protein